jgi:hypothetical protein
VWGDIYTTLSARYPALVGIYEVVYSRCATGGMRRAYLSEFSYLKVADGTSSSSLLTNIIRNRCSK